MGFGLRGLDVAEQLPAEMVLAKWVFLFRKTVYLILPSFLYNSRLLLPECSCDQAHSALGHCVWF